MQRAYSWFSPSPTPFLIVRFTLLPRYFNHAFEAACPLPQIQAYWYSAYLILLSIPRRSLYLRCRSNPNSCLVSVTTLDVHAYLMAESRILGKGKAEAPVKWIYRCFFLYIEPFSALLGAYYAFSQPEIYLDLTHAASSPKVDIPISTQIILGQLSNLYLFFAMNEALVLRATFDLRVWRTTLFCLLVADIGHLYSVRSLGLQIYWNISQWNSIDWGNIGFVYLGAATRISFLLGYGVVSSQARRSIRRKAPRAKVR